MRLVTPSSTHGTEKKSIATIGFLAALLLFATQSAHADTPQRFMLQGTILTPAGLPQEASNVDFTIEIRSPGTEDCLLYRETHSLNMTNSGGAFSLAIGSGVRSGAGFQQSSTLRQVFNNAAALRTGLECKNGADYDAAAGESRNVVVSFNDGSGPQTLTQVLNVQAVPYSLFAETASQIGDLLPVDILQTNILTRALSQSNLESVFFNQARVDELNDLLDGTSAKYLNTVGALSFGDTITMSGAGTSLVVNNGATFGGVISSSNTTASTSTTTGALVVNGGVGVAGAINSGSTVNAATSMRTPIIYGSSAASGSLTLESTSDPTKGYVLLNPNGGNVGIGTTTPSKALSVNGDVAATRFITTQTRTVLIGDGTSAAGEGTIVGSGAVSTSGNGTIAIGQNSQANGDRNIAIGAGASSGSGQQSIAIGSGATATGFSGIALGRDAHADTAEFVVGSSTVDSPVSAMYLGSGKTSAAPVSASLNATSGLGTDISGANFTFRGGKSTGTGGGGFLSFETTPAAAVSGSTLNTSVERVRITGEGNVGIGTDTPMATLDVNGNINIPTATSTTGQIKMNGAPLLHAYGTQSTFLGINAGNFNNVQFLNVGVGTWSLNANTTGNQNTAIGQASLAQNTTGTDNTAIGRKAGVTADPSNANTTGNQNTYVGSDAGPATPAQLNNSMALGFGSRVTASNQVVIGNTDVVQTLLNGHVGIGTATPQAKLDVNGYMRLAKNAAQPVACSVTNDGAIALTSQYTMCVCKGGSSAWVSTTNGTTACAW